MLEGPDEPEMSTELTRQFAILSLACKPFLLDVKNYDCVQFPDEPAVHADGMHVRMTLAGTNIDKSLTPAYFLIADSLLIPCGGQDGSLSVAVHIFVYGMHFAVTNSKSLIDGWDGVAEKNGYSWFHIDPTVGTVSIPNKSSRFFHTLMDYGVRQFQDIIQGGAVQMGKIDPSEVTSATTTLHSTIAANSVGKGQSGPVFHSQRPFALQRLPAGILYRKENEQSKGSLEFTPVGYSIVLNHDGDAQSSHINHFWYCMKVNARYQPGNFRFVVISATQTTSDGKDFSLVIGWKYKFDKATKEFMLTPLCDLDGIGDTYQFIAAVENDMFEYFDEILLITPPTIY